jgi:nicotinamidase-related amidase
MTQTSIERLSIMKLAPIPAVDAPHGAYRERTIEPRKTALLSIDMQNSEWSPERMAKARMPGSKEAPYLDIMEKIQNQLIPNQQRLQAAARKAGIEVIYTTIESYTLDGRDRSLDHKISDLFCAKGRGSRRSSMKSVLNQMTLLFPRQHPAFSIAPTSSTCCAISALSI